MLIEVTTLLAPFLTSSFLTRAISSHGEQGLQIAQVYLSHEQYADTAKAHILELENELAVLRERQKSGEIGQLSASIEGDASNESKRSWWRLGVF